MPSIQWRVGSLYLLAIIFITMMMIPESTPSFLTHYCSNTSTYSANSIFANNLKILVNSLASNASNDPTGFYTTSIGNSANTVYGFFMCRGDLNTSECSDCVRTAVRDLPRTTTCHMSKQDIIFYDECMLRYDNQSLVGKMTESPAYVLENTQNISGNQEKFENLVGNTMTAMMPRASISNHGKKYETAVENFTSYQKVYALEQCVPDLTASDCTLCLTYCINQLQFRQGWRILTPSCNVHYEIYPYFRDAEDLALSPPPTAATNNTSGKDTGTNGKKKVSAKVIIAIVAPAATITLALIIFGICLTNRSKIKKLGTTIVSPRGEDFSTIELSQYDLDILQSATNNFSEENKLGEGGFGGVYKGTLANGREIAVKKLSRISRQGEREFKNEVLLVAKLQHRNLVKLLGFCLVGEEKMLVYEYIPNKSLDHFLFDPEKRGILDWTKRLKIIQGIARGMLYLHQDSQLMIIHRDLKASNILLDTNMNPKISDFGIARIFQDDQTRDSTSRVIGTYGYMAPEYAMQGQFSTKSDVYSFGVLMLEIISGKRTNCFHHSYSDEDLLSFACKQWREGSAMDLVDPIVRNCCSSHEVMRCIQLAKLCVQESVNERPTMATIVLMLDSNTTTLPVLEISTSNTKSWNHQLTFPKEMIDSDKSSNNSTFSVNDVTISDPGPR